MIKVNQAPIPIYFKIKQEIQEKILKGELLPEDRIPSEEKLAKEYHISRMTARHAITELVNEGYLYRIHGKGTFVSKTKVEKSVAYLSGFAEDMQKKGYVATSKVIGLGKIVPTEKIKDSLELSKGELVYELKRARYANDKIVVLQYSYLPEKMFPKLENNDFSKQSLYKILEDNYAVTVNHANQKMEAMNIDKEKAQYLEIPEGSAVLYVDRVSFNEEGVPVEEVYSWYRGDRYTFEVNLYREM